MPYATCLMSHVRRVRHAAAGMRTVPFELAVRNAGMNAGFVHTQTCSRVFFAFMVGYHGHGTPALTTVRAASRVGVACATKIHRMGRTPKARKATLTYHGTHADR